MTLQERDCGSDDPAIEFSAPRCALEELRAAGLRSNVIKHGANHVHPVVDVDEIHRRRDEQLTPMFVPWPAALASPAQPRLRESTECPFIAGGPELLRDCPSAGK